MATSDPQATLKEAYRYLKGGDKDEAIRLIKPVIQADRDNAAAWWLLANAVSKPEHARQALEQVLRLRPADERARVMLDRLNTYAAPPEPVPPPEPPRHTAAEDPFAILDKADDPFGDPFADVGTDDPFGDANAGHEDPFGDPFEDAGYASDAYTDPFADSGQPLYNDGPYDAFGSQSSSSVGAAALAYTEADPFKGVPGLPVGNKGVRAANSGSISAEGQRYRTFAYGVAAVLIVVLLVALGAVLMGLGSGNAGRNTPPLGECAADGGQSVNCGSLSLDERWEGRIYAGQYHRWFVDVAAGQQVRIDATSAFDDDTYLELYQPNGVLLATNDDGGLNFEARIELTLHQAGTYEVRVRMFRDLAGRYELMIRDEGIDSSAASDPGSSSEGSSAGSTDRCLRVSSSSDAFDTYIACGDVAPGATVRDNLGDDEIHVYRLVAEAGRRITIEMERTGDLDPLLTIVDEDSGRVITENDDIDLSEGNRNSRVSFTVPSSGVVVIEAGQFGFGGGSYILRIMG